MHHVPSVPRPSRRSILAASLASPLLALPVVAARKVPPAALLTPLTGARAALGRSMARAAALAQGRDGNALQILDTGGSAPGAALAVRTAMKHGAGLILGPLTSEETRAALAETGGRVPIVTFSNDERLRESGAFILGVTADQRVGAICRYARGRGLRRIALGTAGSEPWTLQVATAARRAAEREGLALVSITGDPDGVILAAPGGSPRGGPQLLCAFSADLTDPDQLVRLEGAWLAAPDPAGFTDFSTGFEAATGSQPGLIAGLAYDGSNMIAQLRRGGGVDRSALLAGGGFAGVCGTFHFREDGSASRDLAILAVERGAYRVVDHPAGNTTNR